MNIKNIKEAGANNILMWAISSGANIKSDQQLQSLINDETFYQVTMSNVNFFEVFRLTQMYREKIRLMGEQKADMPPRSELVQLFNGSIATDPENSDERSPLYPYVENVIGRFIDLALQMGTDDDIIPTSSVRMFLPMISRKFDIQIPVSFIDLVESISPEESERIFTSEYPKTLQKIVDNKLHSFNTIINMAFLRATSILKYNKRYDKYLGITKYSPLKLYRKNTLYKFGVIGFNKYDAINRTEVRANLFNANQHTVGSTLKRLNRIPSPLCVDFAVQMPIQYMQILLNSFDREALNVSYESSMSTIIDDGIIYDDFITKEFNTEDDSNTTDDHNNSISAYRVRISEANEILIRTIPLLLSDMENNDVDITSVFSLLPSIYMTKAVITVKLEYSSKYISHYDPVISSMFSDMLNMASDILEDIAKSK